MKNISTRQIIDIVLLILLLIFIGQNLESVKVKFIAFGFEMPLVILIAIVFFIGYYTAKARGRRAPRTRRGVPHRRSAERQARASLSHRGTNGISAAGIGGVVS